jgi:hypothetical protein
VFQIIILYLIRTYALALTKVETYSVNQKNLCEVAKVGQELCQRPDI